MNYKKTITESILLFVGIFLALLLENYVADQELNDKQNRLLSELALDLDETISDIQNDIASHSAFFDRTKDIIEILNQNNSEQQRNLATDQLTLQGIQEICINYAFVVPKTSTYESIKSLGLDLIEENSLRTQISGFYELTLFRISTAEKRIYDFTDRECWSYVANNFTWSSQLKLTTRDVRLGPNSEVMDWMAVGELDALDYSKLVTDPIFKSIIQELVIRRSFQLLHYRIGLTEALRLRSSIEQYLS